MARHLLTRLSPLMTLRLKIALVVLFGVLSFTAYNVEESARSLRSTSVETARREVLAIARTFAPSFSAAELSNPDALFSRLVRLRADDPELVRATIYVRSNGMPIGLATSTDQPDNNPAGADDVAPLDTRVAAYHEETTSAGQFAELNYPLGPSSRPYAVLGLYFDLHRLSSEVAHRTRRLLVLGTLAGLITAVLVVAILEWLLFAPIRRLKGAARAIGRGRTSTRMDWRRSDELGQLADEFDRMAEAVQERERLEELALRDSLTGLSNHRDFHDALRAEMERALAGAETPISLVALDLDHFKVINDEFGHPVGDEVLRAVGQALRRFVRASDTVARLGGEEFALLLPGADATSAAEVAEQARRAVAELIVSPGVKVRCSAGVATYPVHAGDGSALLECADGALYWAKRSGRNQVRVYDPHHVSTASTAQRRAEIVAVLEDPDGIRPVFQPLLDLHTGVVAGYEALARFPNSGSARTPDLWVAEAHRCGLGPDLEAQAVRAAFSIERPDEAFLSVNLSPSVAGSRQVLDALPEDLTGVVLELTEHEALSGEGDGLDATLADLRARGARIAVDDAGAGYAGLQHVMRLRPDIVKLDRALVTGVAGDPARAALIECFVTFARRTNAQVCAEGIENAEDLRTLAALGVDYAQGYLLARPAAPWTSIDPAAADSIAELSDLAPDC